MRARGRERGRERVHRSDVLLSTPRRPPVSSSAESHIRPSRPTPAARAGPARRMSRTSCTRHPAAKEKGNSLQGGGGQKKPKKKTRRFRVSSTHPPLLTPGLRRYRRSDMPNVERKHGPVLREACALLVAVRSGRLGFRQLGISRRLLPGAPASRRTTPVPRHAQTPPLPRPGTLKVAERGRRWTGPSDSWAFIPFYFSPFLRPITNVSVG
ncbi:hypothetical protein LY76DRAFT_176552 [Colletotrichum caudatum]|nr:hypothetical protein LY76DRAFT_176552 [Colletotrichum caudatum]